MSSAIPPDPAGPRPTPLVPLDRPGHLSLSELPLPLTSFVGREREVAAVTAALRRDDVRLLTLTGPGGVGKSRLALRVAEELAGDYPDGVWFVPLALVRDPALVAATVAGTLGVRETPDRPLVAGLQAFLRAKQALLILDNFEHVLEAAPLVTDLLSTCPRLRALVTSRAVLRLSGEHDVAVPPLSLDSEAVRLFVERARAARDDFALTSDNASAVAAICHRLDGLPLAIELAAAQSRLLAPLALLARLETRLPLLTGGPRDQPVRLQTMRNAIAWSYDLLTVEQQALFRRLSVFVGGFTLEAAEAVAEGGRRETERHGASSAFRLPPSALDGLASLVDTSLVWREGGPGGESRFGMLETIREFGLEQLAASGEEAAIQAAHAAAVLALVEQAEPHLFGPDQAAWLDRIEVELPNIRAALGWLHARGRAEEGLRLAAAPGRFWWRRGYLSEGRGWIERFLLLPVAETATPTRVKALIVVAGLAAWQKDHERAEAWYTEALDLAIQLGDKWGRAMALYGLGNDAVDQDDLARAEPLLAESVARFQDLGDASGIGCARAMQGRVALVRGDHVRAAACFNEALALFREQQDWRYVAATLDGLAQLTLGRGEFEAAREILAESLTLSARLGDKTGIAWCLMELAGVAGAAGQSETAARLLGASAALRSAIGVRFAVHEQRLHDRIDAAARAPLGEAAFAAAWERGAALPLAEAVAEATAVAALSASRLPPPAAFAGLTVRELEVLRLLADGRSDKEIAAALFVSRPTASKHVAAIRAKLGLPSRAAVAAYVARRLI